MRQRTAPAVLLAAVLTVAGLLATVPPAAGDDVFLTNGRVFEGVVAEVQRYADKADRVAIRLPGGTISIPAHRVDRIVRDETALERFLERRDALTAEPGGGSAAAWVELARWARVQGLDSGYRQAARRAADLDPRAPGLAPLMRHLGLLFDDSADRWLSEEQIMRRRGYVQFQDTWVTPEQRAAALARTAEAAARQREARDDARRDAVLLAMASALADEARAERTGGTGYASQPVTLGTSAGFWVPAAPFAHHDRRHHADPQHDKAHRGGDRHHAGPDRGRDHPAARRHGGGSNRGSFRASDWIPGRLNPGAAPPPGTLSGRTARDR